MATKQKSDTPNSQNTQCDHTFVVTCWQQGGGKEKAIAMRCQKCLCPRNLQELESVEFRQEKGI